MTDNNTAIVQFKPSEVGEFGNKFLGSLLAHEIAKEEAEQEIQRASERESLIDAQLIQIAMYLHDQEAIDVYKVYGEKQETSSLYRAILVEMGVLERKIVDDKVNYDFVDPELAGAFSFEQAIASYKHDPEKDEKPLYPADKVAEHKMRRSRRNGLNVRLQRICKAAVALLESKATIDNVVITQGDNGTEVKITKGPKEIMGAQADVSLGSRNTAKVEGASQTPTISGLAKVADSKHKPASKQSTETSNKSPESGKGAEKESDFVALVNTLIKTINGREEAFTDVEKNSLKSLKTTLSNNGIK